MKLSRIPRALLAARREVIKARRLDHTGERERSPRSWEAARDEKWLKAARQRLAEKRAQARLDPKPRTAQRPIEWDPIAFLLGVFLGSRF